MPDTTTLHHPRRTRMPVPGATHDAAIAELQSLIDVCADGAYGFACCADYTNSSRQRMWFRQRAQQCDAAGAQLRAMVLQLGGQRAPASHESSGVHRGWVAMRGTLCGLRDQSILNECDRGEAAALALYRLVLEQPLPDAARALVQQQCDTIAASLAQMRSWRDAPGTGT
jgi:uncharacterized protein (TIGR02284 family)